MFPDWPTSWAEWVSIFRLASELAAFMTWGCVLWNGARHRLTQKLLRLLVPELRAEMRMIVDEVRAEEQRRKGDGLSPPPA